METDQILHEKSICNSDMIGIEIGDKKGCAERHPSEMAEKKVGLFLRLLRFILTGVFKYYRIP